MGMVDMVIPRLWFSSGPKSRSANNSVQHLVLGLQKSTQYQKPKEKQVPIYGTIKHSGNLVFSGRVPQPGTKVLMTRICIIVAVWNAFALSPCAAARRAQKVRGDEDLHFWVRCHLRLHQVFSSDVKIPKHLWRHTHGGSGL